MAFPLLGLIPGILRTIGSIIGVPAATVAADAIQNAQIPPEKLAELQDALQRHELAMKALSVDELKTAVSESIAMVTSADKYTSRARPTMLYVATGITALLCLIIGIAILAKIKIDLAIAGVITPIMLPLWGAGGYYIYARTQEKLNSNGAHD